VQKLTVVAKDKPPDEDDPFAFIKKEKPKKLKIKVEGEEEAKKKEESEGGSSFRKKKSPGKKIKKVMHGMLLASSSKNLEELKDDGTVPKALIKETNESVDLMKKADEKLKQVLEFYLP
jgi:hypothetical protein